ncbi:hypothetical protein [Streptomyces cucumeris]|uniref:hypothetical protein n=1 Tax=Streptomyces cucumeris TaxID=2962890 RepID=UPI003D7217CF
MASILARTAAAAGAGAVFTALFTSPAFADNHAPVTPDHHRPVASAAAAPNVSFGSRADIGGDGTVWAKDRNGNIVAEAHWQADPGGTTYPQGDTLYVSDFMGDGLGARGEASVGIKISPSGSGDRVQRTKNVAEGKRLSIKLCMTSSSGTRCSSSLGVRA